MSILYALVQCSWGAIQTLAGLILFLTARGERHFMFHGAVATVWKGRGNVSLGMFIFVNESTELVGCYSQRMLSHEYGHTIQSLILGPLYLLVIGLPSFLWCNVPAFERKRQENGIAYSSFYTEKWADYHGERVRIKRNCKKA